MSAARRERWYRRLLFAFPGRFRRQHGDALVGTLLDTDRPARREAPHLLAAGLGHRFRPARSPFAWVATLLVALTAGAVGATLGSWAGERAYAELPAAAPLAASLAAGNGEVAAAEVQHLRLFADITMPVGADPDAAVGHARQHLAGAGWSTSPPVVAEATPGSLREYRFSADSGGIRMTVHSFVDDGQGHLVLNGWPLATPAYQPLVVAGLLAGLLAGWLLTAALTHRIAAGARPVAAGLALTLSVVAGAGPALLLLLGLPEVLVDVSSAQAAPSLWTMWTISPWSLVGLEGLLDPEWSAALEHNLLLLATAAGAWATAGLLSTERAPEPEVTLT